jgi:hypothetical protein
MGTRNLICVVVNNEYRAASYSQWDGYPQGQGLTALNFLNTQYKPKLFKEKVLATKWLSNDEVKKLWQDAGADPESDGWVTIDVSDKFKENNYHLSRDCGANIFNIIQESPAGLGLVDSVEFAASWSCEWAYVIDLDKNTFEVYENVEGPELTPNDRFYFLIEQFKKDGEECEPVRMVKSYSLDELPTKEQFVKDLCPSEEENNA